MFREEGVSWVAYGTFGGFHVFLNPNNLDATREQIESGQYDYATMRAPVKPSLLLKLRTGVILHGVDIQNWPGAPVSAVHTDDDRDRTVEAFRHTIAMLRQEKEIE